jgi:hypothetical protein
MQGPPKFTQIRLFGFKNAIWQPCTSEQGPEINSGVSKWNETEIRIFSETKAFRQIPGRGRQGCQMVYLQTKNPNLGNFFIV